VKERIYCGFKILYLPQLLFLLKYFVSFYVLDTSLR